MPSIITKNSRNILRSESKVSMIRFYGPHAMRYVRKSWNMIFSLFNLEGALVRGRWGFSSAGRAPALQAGGQRFDPANLHQDGPIAQLARAHD